MEREELRAASTYRGANRELLSLAFDCSEMVAKLTEGYKLERQGEHASAVSALDSVKGRLETWLEKLDELDTEGIDKKKISRELKEAREAIHIDT